MMRLLRKVRPGARVSIAAAGLALAPVIAVGELRQADAGAVSRMGSIQAMARLTSGNDGVRLLGGPTLAASAQPQSPSAGWFFAEQGHYPSQYAAAVAISGTTAYLENRRSLDIVDWSDPQAPVKLSTIAVDAIWTHQIAVEGKIAYLATQSGLLVIDVADPLQPRELGMFVPPGEYPATGSVAVKGVAATTNSVGIHLIDIDDPSAPRLLATIPAEAKSLFDVAIEDSHLFASAIGDDAESELLVYDISVPVSPTLMAVHFVGGCCEIFSYPHLAIDGNMVYVTAGGRLTIVDVSDPAAPVSVGRHDSEHRLLAASGGDDRVFVAEGGWGFHDDLDLARLLALNISQLDSVERRATWHEPKATTWHHRFLRFVSVGEDVYLPRPGHGVTRLRLVHGTHLFLPQVPVDKRAGAAP